MSSAHILTWGIAALATAGVIMRPWGLPEAVWAVAGAASLVIFGGLPAGAAIHGIRKGLDVYLFLTGMMVLAELARREGLFDWLAARAATLAAGSATRLFSLVYGLGIIVTVFLSNDATAVVLTPAVAAVARAAKVERPLPYLFACAFIANAASFVLPISNPANLVIYGSRLPSLLHWLPRYALPSLLSIGSTYVVLRLTQRSALAQALSSVNDFPTLSRAAVAATMGIITTAAIVMCASGVGMPLGLPTFIAGMVTLLLVSLTAREPPWIFLRDISWGVLPMVAGMFVLVEGLDRSGVIHAVCELLRAQVGHSSQAAAAGSGLLIGLLSNLINNLPAGLIAGIAAQSANVPSAVSSAILIGVDVGPNLSVTGSLATILWLTALRRDGFEIKAWDFFKLGVLIMPPALLLSLTALLLEA